MIAVSVSVEGVGGLTWFRWKRLIAAIEQLGFAGLYCSDHLVLPDPVPTDSLEMVLALGYLADHTQRVHFGPLVSPLSFRDPVMLARQAAALDNLSDGRMILGVGAGWMEREHEMFGYHLGDMSTRMDRFEEGLEVITHLLQNVEPVSYTGRFYQLQDAFLRPRSPRPHGPPILIGGKGARRTLPLVARHADIWNATGLKPDAFRERSAQLDELLQAVGRQPRDVKRTVLFPIYCARNEGELEQRLSWLRIFPDCATIALDALAETVGSWFSTAIIGSPESIIERIHAYAEVGVEEVIVQWFGLDDIEGLQILAEQVVPHL
jgi:alkanesulfonate monooxygenase SsuD/methylene tetrahydromethanopterin reductase-like flavin-dependent oxidoreductase (luciferase family)